MNEITSFFGGVLIMLLIVTFSLATVIIIEQLKKLKN